MVNGNESLVELGPLGIFLAFGLIVWMFFAQVLNYVFHATACSQIMQIKKISRPFLAWLPIGGNYSLGKICDSINNKNNKKSNFKILLTIFSSCLLATYAFCVIIYKASASAGQTYAPNNRVLTFLLLGLFGRLNLSSSIFATYFRPFSSPRYGYARDLEKNPDPPPRTMQF